MSNPDEIAGDVLAVIRSHASSSGLFERVNGHESLAPSGNGLTAAVWVQRIDPALSGLDATSVRLTVKVRIYSPMQEPRDAIDPAVTAAAWALFRAYSGDFSLGGAAREIPLLGSGGGVALFAEAAYLRWEDGTEDRVMDITVPVIINDAFDQEA